ncbi:MAG: hypothetical protein D6753_10125 [Planctomycetota bacterium]|nr:MAG: hypothetical protein D6753_10125 [Planctomycetota bacterium]
MRVQPMAVASGLPQRLRARWRWPPGAVAVLVMLVVCGTASSQDAGVPQGAMAFPQVLETGALPVEAEIRFRDESGELIFVPNVTMRDLIQARMLASGSGPNPFRQFTYRQTRLDVEVNNGYADVVARFEIELGPSARAADVPLALSTVQLESAQPQFDGPQARHQFVAENTGYRWILQDLTGQADAPRVYTVVLRGKTKIADEADRRSLLLPLPTGPAEVHVTLPAGTSDPRVRAEDILEFQPGEPEVRLKILSRGGAFQVSWKRPSAIASVASVEAQSRTLFEVTDPVDAWKATTNLTVRWYGPDADNRFRIALPPGARWRSFPQPDFDRFSISLENTSSGSEDGASSQGADVRLQEDSQRAVLVIENHDLAQTSSIDLTCEWEWSPDPPESESTPLTTVVPCLSVSGVYSHRGIVDLQYPASYSLVFEEGESSRLIQQGRLPDLFAVHQLRFEFRKEPSDMRVTFRPERSDPTVRPVYHVHLDGHKIDMTVWLECSFDITRHQLELSMDFGKWALQENTARWLAGPDDPLADVGETLEVRDSGDGRTVVLRGIDPDPNSYTTNRRIEQIWRVEAQMDWDADENTSLSFALPQILLGRGTGVPAGALIISAEDNMLVSWDQTNSQGLFADAFSEEYGRYVRLSGTRQPQVFRFPSQSKSPVWAGDVKLLPQVVAAEETVRLEVVDGVVSTTQQWNLRVANEPLNEIHLAVPADVTGLQVYIDQTLTSAEPIGPLVAVSPQEAGTAPAVEPGETADVLSGEYTVYAIPAAAPILGTAEVQVVMARSWSAPPQSSGRSAPPPSTTVSEERPVEVEARLAFLHVPHIRPVVRYLTLGGDYFIEATDASGREQWAYVPHALPDAGRGVAADIHSIRLTIQPHVGSSAGSLSIRNSWLQTAISGDQRRDRYVARFLGMPTVLRIKLPDRADVRNNRVRALIDSVPTDAVYDSRTDSLIVAIPSADAGDGAQPQQLPAERTLDLFYSVRSGLQSLTRLEVAAPLIEGASQDGRFYWQLAVPRTQHLLWTTDALSPEWRWRWNGFCFARHSVFDEPELTRMLQAAEVDELPVSVNRYVLSGPAPDQPFRVWVAARHVLWLPTGLLAILVTVLVVNVPLLRSPVFGLLLGMGIMTLAVVAPDFGILLGQTVALSLSLALLIIVAHAAIDSRVRRRSVFTTRPATHTEPSEHFSVAPSVQIIPATAGHGSSVTGREGG